MSQSTSTSPSMNSWGNIDTPPTKSSPSPARTTLWAPSQPTRYCARAVSTSPDGCRSCAVTPSSSWVKPTSSTPRSTATPCASSFAVSSRPGSDGGGPRGEVGVGELAQPGPVDLVGLLTVDEHRLAVQPDPGVHGLGDDALVLPDLHRPAVDADRLVRLGRRLRAVVGDPDGGAGAGELRGGGQPGRAGTGDEPLHVRTDVGTHGLRGAGSRHRD